MAGFREAGHQVVTFDLSGSWHADEVDPAGRLQRCSRNTAQLHRAVKTGGLDATFGMWTNGVSALAPLVIDGREHNPLQAVGVPHVFYWLDAPHWAVGGTLHAHFGAEVWADPLALHVVNNRPIADEMSEVLGFGACAAMPYGVNPAIFTPHNQTPREDVIMNVGPGDPPPTPSMLAALDSEDPPIDEIRREVAQRHAGPALDELLRPHGDSALAAGRALLESQLADRHAPMLQRARRISASGPVADGLQTILSRPALWVAATALVRSVDAWHRAFTACWLAKRVQVAVVGGFSEAWPFEGRRLGEVRYEDLARAYAQGRVGLNVMRWQDDQGSNIKPLEISASGLPAVCGRRVGLEDLLEPGREYLDFETPREALEAVRSLLDDSSRRRAIADAGRERTLRDHTWAQRAKAFEAIIANARAERALARIPG